MGAKSFWFDTAGPPDCCCLSLEFQYANWLRCFTTAISNSAFRSGNSFLCPSILHKTQMMCKWIVQFEGTAHKRGNSKNTRNARFLQSVLINRVVLFIHMKDKKSSSSSSCSWRVRCVPCSLILKVELVPPSLLRSSYVPSSFWSVS